MIAAMTTGEMAAALRHRGWTLVPPAARGRAYPGLVIAERWVLWRGRRVGLSRREAQVVAALAAAWPAPLTSNQLLEAVWGPDFSRCVTGHLATIRERVPGLLVRVGPGGGGWTLDLEEAT